MDRTEENIRRLRTWDWAPDKNPDHWITVKGAKIHIDNEGKADGGAGGQFNGQKMKALEKLNSSLKGAKKEENSLTKAPEKNKIREDGTAEKNENGFGGASAKEFSSGITEAKKTVDHTIAWRVAEPTPEEIKENHKGSVCHKTKGGSTVAVSPDGDIWGVCKNRNDKIFRGKDLIELAINQGGKKLDSYEGNHNFYVKCGFEPVSWCKWDDDYAPSDWDSGLAREDIIFYKYVGIGKVNPAFIAMENFKNHVTASVDYDEAQKKRDANL